jgi:DNA polymerase elongation subunit (family B)
MGIAERARHPNELKQDSGNWMVDIDYYLSQQVLKYDLFWLNVCFSYAYSNRRAHQ